MSLSSTDLNAMPWSLMTPNEISVTNIIGKNKRASVQPVEPVKSKVPDDAFSLFGNGGFTFADMLDIVNPLQHVPIIAPIYREITGDTLSPAARIAGNTLFGGPIGLATGLINTIVEANTGADIGGNVFAAFTDDNKATHDNKQTSADIMPLLATNSQTAEAQTTETQTTETQTTKPQSDSPQKIAPQIKNATVETATISELPPPLPAKSLESKDQKIRPISQPDSLNAFQMQISAQMALQIAEANARQVNIPKASVIELAAPEKSKPKESLVEKPANVMSANHNHFQKTAAPYNAPENISLAMAAALDKYQQIYASSK